jgi:hypothetical protein
VEFKYTLALAVVAASLLAACGGAGRSPGSGAVLALGKAAAGSMYCAAVYVAGVVGGIGAVAGDWNTYGRIYVNGAGRGLFFSN